MLNCFIYHRAIFQQHRWITITTTANLHTHEHSDSTEPTVRLPTIHWASEKTGERCRSTAAWRLSCHRKGGLATVEYYTHIYLLTCMYVYNSVFKYEYVWANCSIVDHIHNRWHWLWQQGLCKAHQLPARRPTDKPSDRLTNMPSNGLVVSEASSQSGPRSSLAPPGWRGCLYARVLTLRYAITWNTHS